MSSRKKKNSSKSVVKKDFSVTEPKTEEVKLNSTEVSSDISESETIKPKTRRRVNAAKKRNPPIPVRLAQKLKQIRLDNNLTQAKMLGIVNPDYSEDNRARLSAYEKGTRVPSLIELWNYAKFAGIPMETLVDDDADLP